MSPVTSQLVKQEVGRGQTPPGTVVGHRPSWGAPHREMKADRTVHTGPEGPELPFSPGLGQPPLLLSGALCHSLRRSHVGQLAGVRLEPSRLSLWGRRPEERLGHRHRTLIGTLLGPPLPGQLASGLLEAWSRPACPAHCDGDKQVPGSATN